jgi:hypothetical protein
MREPRVKQANSLVIGQSLAPSLARAATASDGLVIAHRFKKGFARGASIFVDHGSLAGIGGAQPCTRARGQRRSQIFRGEGLQRLEWLLSRPERDMPVAEMAKLAAATADVLLHGASFLDRPTFCASVASARGARVSRGDQGLSHRGREPGIALSHLCVHHARLYNDAWVRAGWVPWVPRSQAEKV